MDDWNKSALSKTCTKINDTQFRRQCSLKTRGVERMYLVSSFHLPLSLGRTGTNALFRKPTMYFTDRIQCQVYKWIGRPAKTVSTPRGGRNLFPYRQGHCLNLSSSLNEGTPRGFVHKQEVCPASPPSKKIRSSGSDIRDVEIPENFTSGR